MKYSIMEHRVKPIHEKSICRIQEINAFVNSYHPQRFSHRRTINRVQHQQLVKIRKAEKLNEEKEEVKELRNTLMRNENQKDVEVGYIYDDIKNSALRASKVKANNPLKKITFKTEPQESYLSKENEASRQTRSRQSNLSSFFRGKTNRLLRESTADNMSFISNCSQNRPTVPFSHQKSEYRPSYRLSKKPSRRHRIKSKTTISDVAHQIQELIHKNMRVVNESLVRLNIDPDPPKRQNPYQPITIHISDCILNYKPSENKFKAAKQQGSVPMTIQRKKFSRTYTKNAFKLSSDALKQRLNDCQTEVKESEAINKSSIKESMQRVYDAVDQFRCQKGFYKQLSSSDPNLPQQLLKRQPRAIEQHPRLQTQIQSSSPLKQESKTRFWESFSGNAFKLHI